MYLSASLIWDQDKSDVLVVLLNLIVGVSSLMYVTLSFSKFIELINEFSGIQGENN